MRTTLPQLHQHRARTVSWLVLAAVGLAACSRDRPAAVVVDSALQRDLTLAASATPARTAQAPLGDTAITTPAKKVLEAEPQPVKSPAPRPRRAPLPVIKRPEAITTAEVPAPTQTAPVLASVQPADVPAPGPAPARKFLGAGTALVAKTNAQICSLSNKPGDRLVANLSEDVVGADGVRLAAGTPVLVEMAEAQPPAVFAFRVKSVQVDGVLIPTEGTVTATGETVDHRVSKGGDKGKVIGGAIAGAILGRVLGGGAKGTVIGAAGGAAAGTVAAERAMVTEHCLPAGIALTVTLSAPLFLSGSSGIP